MSPKEAGGRLDGLLSARLGISRRASQALVRAGGVVLGSDPVLRPSRAVGAAQALLVRQAGASDPEVVAVAPRLIYQDSWLAVVDKPPGLVVQPGAGHRQGSLAQQLRAWPGPWAEAEGEERLGIVHRLDRGTSGLLVLARTEPARQELRRQLRRREMGREYWALVQGRIEEERGRVEAAVGRDWRSPRRMAVTQSGRPAATDFWVLERLRRCTALGLRLETGRTHQIRVHLAYIGRPVAGDSTYGGAAAGERLALHAAMLHLRHPETRREMVFLAPLPPDLERLRLEAGAPAGTSAAWPWGA
ncbi:MAG: RluA family pseudouridine synthase [Candidatus Dormibacteria bacterium]